MNEFFERYARQSHESGAAKTFLAIDNADSKRILGFYRLARGALACAETPETVRRGLARHAVPGFRLARIARDLRCQGKERPRGPVVRQLRHCAFEQQTSDTRNVASHIRRQPEGGRAAMSANL